MPATRNWASRGVAQAVAGTRDRAAAAARRRRGARVRLPALRLDHEGAPEERRPELRQQSCRWRRCASRRAERRRCGRRDGRPRSSRRAARRRPGPSTSPAARPSRRIERVAVERASRRRSARSLRRPRRHRQASRPAAPLRCVRRDRSGAAPAAARRSRTEAAPPPSRRGRACGSAAREIPLPSASSSASSMRGCAPSSAPVTVTVTSLVGVVDPEHDRAQPLPARRRLEGSCRLRPAHPADVDTADDGARRERVALRRAPERPPRPRARLRSRPARRGRRTFAAFRGRGWQWRGTYGRCRASRGTGASPATVASTIRVPHAPGRPRGRGIYNRCR